MPISPNRPDLVEGLGELMLAYRTYTGLSQPVFAEMIGIKEGSLSDIEIGRRPCPLPIVDRAEDVLSRFDAEVERTIEAAETMLKSGNTSSDVVRLPVSKEPGSEWIRAVVGRAAATSGLIVPTLEGEHVPV